MILESRFRRLMRHNCAVIVKRSTSGYAETMAALLGAIEGRGLTVFARIDHAGEARAVGLELADEAVVVFGNPRAGTPLMVADPRVGIELPLRMLVWGEGEAALVGYRDPRELSGAYELAGQEPLLEQMAALLEALALEASG